MFFRVEQVSKSFNGKQVLKDISFEVGSGEIVSLIGPSGVGKTTLLSLIADLEKPDSGRIVFAQEPTRENPVILVFQDYVLFPNMNVFDNVAFGLRMRRMSGDRVRQKVLSLLDYFGLKARQASFPSELSAGQRQRVALARAMVVEPSLLLLDEPFANLDKNLKMDTARFIRETHKEFEVTTVSVTHDLEEAFAMSDRMGIMLEGRLIQFDTVSEIYHHPRSLEVAGFLGPVNLIDPVLLPLLGGSAPRNGRPGPIFARPEGIRITKDESGPGEVQEIVFGGHYIIYRVLLAGTTLTVYGIAEGIEVGDRVGLRLLNHLEA